MGDKRRATDMESFTEPSPLGTGTDTGAATGTATGSAIEIGVAVGDGVTAATGVEVLLGSDHLGVGNRVVGLQVPDSVGDNVTGVGADGATGGAVTGGGVDGGVVAKAHCEQSPKTTKVRLVTVLFNFKQV
jgi:hypothetical protein